MENMNMDERTYWYETHASKQRIQVDGINDEDVLCKLQNQYGQHLIGVMIIYSEPVNYRRELDDGASYKTIWIE